MGDQVDLVTGVPLVRQDQLSLPFNGSVFRLVRTRSAERRLSGVPKPTHAGVTDGYSSTEARWWDWAGSGWMMSENPILIVDSTLPDVSGVDGQPRCTLWLDAFHSIPFDWVNTSEGKGYYDCAPRFRASLVASRLNGSARYTSREENGPRRFTTPSTTSRPNSGQWELYPDRFTVSLFDGEITFDFVPVWQDVPHMGWQWNVNPATAYSDVVWTSLHERPRMPLGIPEGEGTPAEAQDSAARSPWILNKPINSGPFAGTPEYNGRGIGMPHYALATRISDKFGNRAEIDYTPQTQWNTGTSFVQFTSQKGQVREIRLMSGDSTVHWTLLYTYRLVPRRGLSISKIPAEDWSTSSLQQKIAASDSVLDTVYVYSGPVDTNRVTILRSPDDSLCTDSDWQSLYPSDSSDPLNTYLAGNAPASLEWPGDENLGDSELATKQWRYRCRNYYAIDQEGEVDYPPFAAAIQSPPELVRTEVQTRSQSGGAIASEDRNTVFLYGATPSQFGHTRWLTHVLDDRGIAETGAIVAPSVTEKELMIRSVLALPNNIDKIGGWPTATANYAEARAIIAQASRLWLHNASEQQGLGDINDAFGPPDREKVKYDGLLPDAIGRYTIDSVRGTAGAFSYTDPSTGRRRFFRVSRYSFAPKAFDSDEIHWTFLSIHSKYLPMRSVFQSPYWWQAYGQGTEYKWPATALNWQVGSIAAEPTDFTKARWVCMLDEFPTWEALRDATTQPIGTGGAEKRSFYPSASSRRLIGMNPQGHVLWQKAYTIDGGRLSSTGDTGLTEKYVYKSGKEILTELEGAVAVTALENAHEEGNFLSELFLAEIKTAGYAAAPIIQEEDETHVEIRHEGLIHVFGYEVVSPDTTRSWGERIRQSKSLIKRGDTGTEYLTSQIFYDSADPTNILGSASFTAARTAPIVVPPGGLANVTPDGFTLSMSPTIKEQEGGLYTRYESRSIAASHARNPHALDDKTFDTSIDITGPNGQSVWSIQACVKDPHTLSLTNDPEATVAFSYNRYDGPNGQLSESWADIDPDQPPADLTIPTEELELLPAQLARQSSGGPANLRTRYFYDNVGHSDTIFPNGRRWATRRVTKGDTDLPHINGGKPFIRIFEFNDLESVGGSESIFETKSLCKITETREFISQWWEPDSPCVSCRYTYVFRTRYVWFTGPININSGEDYTNFVERPAAELAYDSSGRLKSAKQMDLDWDGALAASAEVLDNGDRLRTKEMDGTVTIKIRNGRGQFVRTYVGTNDETWNDNQWNSPERDGSDMNLRERTEFGVGPHDATLPTKSWTYLQTPETTWTSEHLKPFGPGPGEDHDGVLTQTSYDWRMRPVRVDTYGSWATSGIVYSQSQNGPGRPRLSTKLTYLDHANRPTIEASFGSEPRAESFFDSIDPSKFVPSSADPNPTASISSILGKKPTSLIETFYYDDGAVKERRTYRTHADEPSGYQGATDYTAERFGYGAGGREVFAQRSGGAGGGAPIQITVLDNLGRVVREKSVLPRTVGSGGGAAIDTTYELTRTEYGYDADSNVILTARWERIMPSGGSSSSSPSGDAALSIANAVCTLSESWYDASKRLIAAAEYGTGSTSAGSSGTFTTPSGAPTLEARHQARVPASGPQPVAPRLRVAGVEGETEWSVTRAGVPNWIPLTVHSYDRSGNKIGTATQKNFAASESGVQYVFTRMEYDAKGRLFVQTDDATGIKRITKYGYWLGRTVSITSPMNEGTTGSPAIWQTQGSIYGAEVVAESLDATDVLPTIRWIGRNNALVGAMLSTSPGVAINNGSMTPTAEATSTTPAIPPTPGSSGLFPDVIGGLDKFQYDKPDFAYRYYADGLIAERVDRRRLAMRYFYDDQRRLKEVEVWHYPEVTAPTDYVPDNKCAKNIYPLGAAVRGYWPNLSPPVAFGAELEPVDRVGFVEYEYDSRGNTTRVTARTARDVTEIISDTKYVYDERGNLLKEYQAHGCAWNDPEADVPVIQYARSYAAATDTTSGSEHLVSMTYPAFSRAGTAVSGSNVVNFAYGATGSVDAAGGQITAMSMGSMRIAGFGYTGSGRRASMTLGGTATAPALWTNFGGSTPSANALPGLDSFGRVRDLHYVTNGSGNTTLWRGEHEYDASGNRLWEKLTQRPSIAAAWGTGASEISQAAQSGANTRSRRFEYDKLERLIASLSGTLDSGHEIAAGGAAYPTIRSEKWKLDKLGNWSGDSEPATLIDRCSWSQVGQPPYPGIPGGPGSPPGNQQPVSGIGGNGFLPGHSVVFGEDEETEERKVWEAHMVASGITQDATTAQALTSIQPNAIAQVYDFGGGEFRHEQHRTDPCGNLVLDDRYYYQYDAWNRLCSVREKGTLSYFRLDKYGVPKRLEGQDTTPLASYPTTCEWPSIGKLIKNFTYDGVGRLARTSSPVEAPEGWEFEEIEGGPSSAPDPWFTRSERFIYDGVRRIQEIVTDPILSDGESNRVATMSFEHEQRNGGHGGEAGALPTINVFL
ncbi:MAG: hypothetical protein JNM86_16750, partial [Phycisphaerae bacterium]|nr:hypothetical protein [Phycisphaerae bacterium]